MPTSSKKNFLISVVIPVFNEEKNISLLLQRLLPVLQPYSYEAIFIDDGSGDKTASLIKNLAKKEKRIKLVSFQRNFGHQQALAAGYQYAKGEAVISMDSDLQDPPEIIPQMIEKWQNGVEIVYARRSRREADTFFKKMTALWFYKLINFLSDTPIPENIGDFRLLDRKVVNFLNQLPERSIFLRGLVAWGGFTEDYVYFDREKRAGGKTHYTLMKMFNFAIDGITSFSIKPLRLAIVLGFFTSSLGFLGIFYALYRRLFLPHQYWVTGWTALFVSVMFMGGIQLLSIGIISEYIGKIYQQIQQRPRYLVKETVNL